MSDTDASLENKAGNFDNVFNLAFSINTYTINRLSLIERKVLHRSFLAITYWE